MSEKKNLEQAVLVAVNISDHSQEVIVREVNIEPLLKTVNNLSKFEVSEDCFVSGTVVIKPKIKPKRYNHSTLVNLTISLTLKM